MGQLLVMRHAKSDWDANYGADHDRPLNERGIRSARLMGRLLAAEQLVPQVVVSSSAVRAKTTAELAIEAGGWDSALEIESRLYGAGVNEVTGIVAARSEADPLMIVGHQPTWSAVVADLTGQRVEMKTATVAVIDLDLGTLVRVLQPRTHFGGEFDR